MKTFKEKKEKRISKLVNMPFDSLSFDEKIYVIDYKYNNNQKITYEEFVVLLFVTNDELWFWYEDAEYQIDHGISEITSMCMTKYDKEQKEIVRIENYSSIIELLDKFKIKNKNIKEIWNDVSF
ncbi:MAG: hypothetical protein LBV58_01490 [Acholeplasmatales bacterium]|jgi:hypothetical protein|nr:hypothetical protein [Acholeplasmatales bacterium]